MFGVCGVCVCVCGVCVVCVVCGSRFAGENPIRVGWRGMGCADHPPEGPPSRGTALPRDRPPPDRHGADSPKFPSFFPSPARAAAVSHDSPRVQTCTFEGPGASNTTKIPREDPQRERKRTKMGAGEGKKKREILGPHPSGPHPAKPQPSECVCVLVSVCVGVCVGW